MTCSPTHSRLSLILYENMQKAKEGSGGGVEGTVSGDRGVHNSDNNTIGSFCDVYDDSF